MDEDSFYILLLSNECVNLFPENTLSGFTNQVNPTFRLDSNWYMGLSEVFLPPFDQSSQIERSSGKRKRYNNTDDDNLLNEMSDFIGGNENVASKKSRTLVETTVIENIVDGKPYKIVIKAEDLRSIRYSKKNDINMSTFFGSFSNWFKDVPESELHTVKLKVKNDMINYIKNAEWSQIPVIDVKDPHKIYRNVFRLHIYMGSHKSNNVVLRYDTYENVGEFVKSILEQLPNSRRLVNKMTELFNMFYSEYNAESDFYRQTENDKLLTKFADFDAVIKITKADIDQIKNNLQLKDLLFILKNGIKFQNQAITPDEKKAYERNIDAAIYNAVKSNKMNMGFVDKIKKEFDLEVVLPIKYEDQGSKTQRVIVESKVYENIDSFLNDLFAQIPVKARDKTSVEKEFGEALNIADEDQNEIEKGTTKPQTTVISLATEKNIRAAPLNKINTNTGVAQNMFIHIYTDIVKPHTLSNKLVRFLRIIPYNSNHSSGMHVIYESPHYYRVEKTAFENISIYITDSYGNRLKFQASEVPVCVMLHFKRI